ncbi:hypothetical protein CBR_g38037 [Chara braunii]|uniref:Uncharacterized protein n=1 Tax=Chara braunii TaxID=69332 RepID=A0A388K067_CHABU|nr:hypothetical protein CBR_g38037 [Chara braunii]|eukprot:GBG63415.1 hypothetical protein CBR_g38037 [Chara braunii]
MEVAVHIHEGRQLRQTQQKDAAALTAAVRATATHQKQQQQLLNTTTTRVNSMEAKASAAPGCTTDTTKQLGERIDHVVTIIGELGDFTSPATISSTVAAIKTDITKLQTRPDAAPKAYKMPRFNIGKFDDYNKTDALTWWQSFLTEASCHTVPPEDMMKALYLQLIGGAQAWMNHLAANQKCTIAQLHTHIPRKEFKQLWFTRFMVRNVVKAAMNEVYTSSQGNMPTRDWTIKWHKIVTTPGFDLSFPNQRSEFFSRSCAGLRSALGNEYDSTSFQAILDCVKLVIQTDDKAANERQSQQHYCHHNERPQNGDGGVLKKKGVVENGGLGKCEQKVSQVENDQKDELQGEHHHEGQQEGLKDCNDDDDDDDGYTNHWNHKSGDEEREDDNAGRLSRRRRRRADIRAASRQAEPRQSGPAGFAPSVTSRRWWHACSQQAKRSRRFRRKRT